MPPPLVTYPTRTRPKTGAGVSRRKKKISRNFFVIFFSHKKTTSKKKLEIWIGGQKAISEGVGVILNARGGS